MEDLDNLLLEPIEPEEQESVSDGDSIIIEPVNYDMYYTAVYNAVNDAIVANQEVTDYQSIPDIVLKHFEGILANKVLPVDYVIYVGSPYEYYQGNNVRTGYDYCMAYGDLDCNGEYFSGTGTIVTMRTGGQNNIYYMHDQQISLVAPYYYSKSNLGEYPGIFNYNYIELAILIGMVLGGVTWLFRKLLCVKY